MNAKMKAILGKFADAVDGFFAYIMTLCGVLLSSALPLLRQTGTITFGQLGLSWWKLLLGMFVAVVLVGRSEAGGNSSPESKAAKRKNFMPRMATAFIHGVGWTTLFQG